MILFPYDVPVLIVAGYLFFWYFHKKAYHASQFYTPVWMGLSLLFWLNVLLSNLGIMNPWFIPGIALELESTLIGVFYVLAYPLWFLWAGRIFGYLFGKTPQQNGLLWLAGHHERGKPFEPAWFKND